MTVRVEQRSSKAETDVETSLDGRTSTSSMLLGTNG
jgi:hypothetical protein